MMMEREQGAKIDSKTDEGNTIHPAHSPVTAQGAVFTVEDRRDGVKMVTETGERRES